MAAVRTGDRTEERGLAGHGVDGGFGTVNVGVWHSAAAVALFACVIALWAAVRTDQSAPVAVGMVVGLGYTAARLMVSCLYRPVRHTRRFDGTVAAIVPVYNEDPSIFEACLVSVLRQTRPVDELYVVDDGSSSLACVRVAERYLSGRPGAVVHRFERNCGKRHAQAWAMRRTAADVIVTVDSDTRLANDAIAEGLKPLSDDRVQAVTAYVRAWNHRKNVLTNLIALRYANVFLYERAAYSALGSVLCCCGSLSFVRTSVVRRHLDDYVNQRFLGRVVMYGDDRRLTNYALLHGQVAIQTTAVASTIVPERMNHFARQQVRWSKSFFRETLWALRHFGPARWAWWLSAAELAGWAAEALLIGLTVAWPLLGVHIGWGFPLSLALMAYARAVRYPGAEPERGWYQARVFALAPLYGALHLVLLVPLRVYSLATLRDGGWGTRTTVEVRTTEPVAALT